MLTKIGKNQKRGHIHERIRKKLQGTAERPRFRLWNLSNSAGWRQEAQTYKKPTLPDAHSQIRSCLRGAS